MTDKKPKARVNGRPPSFLTRKGRQLAMQQPPRLAERVRMPARTARMIAEEHSRLAYRVAATQLAPCPECDGCGLHKRACRFYMDRAILQAQSNPNAKFNGRLGWLARSMGGLSGVGA